MIIYKITNKLTGKCYIGQTTQTLSRRFAGHRYDINDNLPIHRALKKYGELNFICEEIASYTNMEDLNNAEHYYIEWFNCLIPNGYNIRAGGNNGGALHESTRKKIGDANRGEKNFFYGKPGPMRGKKHTQEAKTAISDSGKGNKNHFYGKKHSLESRQKQSLAKQGSNHWGYGKPHFRRKPILCLETGKAYSCLTEAARQTGFSKNGIGDVATGRVKQIYGFTFRYVEDIYGR